MSTHLPGKIGKYDVFGPIGRGVMGALFAAIDRDRYRKVAIKILPCALPQNADVRNIDRGRQLAARLQHPNIANIYEVGVHEGTPYVVMEYLEGETLDVTLHNCVHLSLIEKINIVIQISHGLACAHRQGIPHHSIKPANIMLCSDGRIKIFDFGIGEVLNGTVTRRVEMIGGPTYLAPEEINHGPVDYRADIFSAAVVLYQLISNHFPFEGDDTVSMLHNIVHEAPPPLSKFLPDYPSDLEPILLRAMAKDPENRYKSADDFAFDLDCLLGRIKEDQVDLRMRKLLSSLDPGSAFEDQPSFVPDLPDHPINTIRLAGGGPQDIQQDEGGKPALALWMQAERALADGQFEEARQHAEQALALSPDDADLQQLWQTICVEGERAEKLRRVLAIAQAAQIEGDLEAARKAAEEAMEVAPNSAEAKACYQLLSREILDRTRHRQIESYLKDARQEISIAKFSGAIEILRRAEELDSNAPGVQSLLQLAVSGLQQERRRIEIDNLTAEIQEALNREDYTAALRQAEKALEKFPQERALTNLKTQAESQIQSSGSTSKVLVDREVAETRELYEGGHFQEVKERLQRVLAQVGPEPRLQSLLLTVSEDIHRQAVEKQKSEALHRATQALSREAYDEAIRILQDVAKNFGEDTDLKKQLAIAQSERASVPNAALHLGDEETDLSRSKIFLQSELQKLPGDKQLQERLAQVSHLDQMLSKAVDEARKLEAAGEYDSALAKWDLIGVLHPGYPGLKDAPKHLRNLKERARADSRQTWIDRIESALGKSEFSQASALVERAIREFPWDSNLMELQEKVELKIRQRTKARKLLSEAQKMLSRQQWERATQALVRAVKSAPEDLVIHGEVAQHLSQASREAMQIDRPAAEAMMRELEQIQPGGVRSAGLVGLRRGDVQSFDTHPAESVTSILRPFQMPGTSATFISPKPPEPDVAPQIQSLSPEMFIPSDLPIDNVQFTVTAPGSLLRGAASEIQFWAHIGRQTEAELIRFREMHHRDVETLNPEGPIGLPGGVCMSIRLRLGGGLECIESHKWFSWAGGIGNASFGIAVPSEVPEGDLVVLASVRLNGCQIGKLSFLLHIGSKTSASQAVLCQTVMHRKAFASYSSSDRDEVMARVREIETAHKGLKIYVDSIDLRSVTYFEHDLYSRIDGAGVFYLFWSRRAKVSDWVTREWRRALKSKGLDFIDPVPLESPESAPPPEELAAKDFNRPLLVFKAVAGVEANHA